MNKPSAKQKKQRELYLALGTVIGFHGYLRNLNSTINKVDILEITQEVLDVDLSRLRMTLIAVEGNIRNKLRNL